MTFALSGTSGACSPWVWVKASGGRASLQTLPQLATHALTRCPRATNLTLLGGFVSYGGIAWARDCAPVFTACTFLNSSSQLGGAVLCDGGCR